MDAVIVVGPPGSGKSTYAREVMNEYKSVREINRDNFRFGVVQPGGSWATWSHNSKDEKMVTSLWKKYFDECVKMGYDLIFTDASYCDPNKTSSLIGKLESLGYKVHTIYMQVSLEECIRRDLIRGKMSVGKEVVEKFWRKMYGN